MRVWVVYKPAYDDLGSEYYDEIKLFKTKDSAEWYIGKMLRQYDEIWEYYEELVQN